MQSECRGDKEEIPNKRAEQCRKHDRENIKQDCIEWDHQKQDQGNRPVADHADQEKAQNGSQYNKQQAYQVLIGSTVFSCAK